MSLRRRLAAALAIAVAVAVCVAVWRSQDPDASGRPADSQTVASPSPAPGAAGSAARTHRAASGVTATLAAAEGALANPPPFRSEEFAMTSELPEGPGVVLRSSARTGNDLSIELATRDAVPEGKRVFATVS